MKKLYRKGTVHPSPPLKPDILSFLPATILTLTVALSPQDREVLAYLISCSSSSNFSGNRRRDTISVGGVDHPPSFNCDCFSCYTSHWVKWDSSPNRQLIHEIIDAYEDGGFCMQSKKEKSRKERRKSRGCSAVESGELKRSDQLMTPPRSTEFAESSDNPIEEKIDDDGGQGEDEMEKGSMRKFVNFLGEKIWGVWTWNKT